MTEWLGNVALSGLSIILGIIIGIQIGLWAGRR